MHYEQRRAPRKRLQNFLPVYDADSRELLGRLVDISSTGLMLISSAPLQEGRQLRLSIQLPTAIDGRTQLHIEATSMWCRSTSHTQHHGTGLRFTSIAEEDKQLLEQLLNPN